MGGACSALGMSRQKKFLISKCYQNSQYCILKNQKILTEFNKGRSFDLVQFLLSLGSISAHVGSSVIFCLYALLVALGTVHTYLRCPQPKVLTLKRYKKVLDEELFFDRRDVEEEESSAPINLGGLCPYMIRIGMYLWAMLSLKSAIGSFCN